MAAVSIKDGEDGLSNLGGGGTRGFREIYADAELDRGVGDPLEKKHKIRIVDGAWAILT